MAKADYIEELFDTMTVLRKLIAARGSLSHEEKAATMLQFAALSFLGLHKDAPVGDLASHLRLSKSSATQLIERLENAGFVNRVQDQNDRRIVCLSITEIGRQEYKMLKRNFLQKISAVFSKIPEADLKELVRIHTKLIDTLKKEEETHGK